MDQPRSRVGADEVAPPASLGGPGFALVEKARATLDGHAPEIRGRTVVVAISGGPDSTCLLDVLTRLSSALDLTLAVAHVDHGLAEASAAVSARVAREAAEAGHDVHLMRASDLAGPNLQARARELRYRFFDSIADQVGASVVATGHTLDDRVETTLARLLHGAAPEQLAGLAPAEGRRIRPLIAIRRAEARAYCDERGLGFHDDPANEELRFERVAVRRLLVEALEEHWGEGAVRAVATSSERLREDSLALRGLAERIYAGTAEEDGAGVSFDLAALTALPRALRRRLLETAVGWVRDRSGGIDAALDALETEGRDNLRFAVAGGGEIAITASHVLVSRSPGRD